MSDTKTNIEQYSERRDSIRQELDKLKSIVDETLKQKKKKELLVQITALRNEMEAELSTSLSAEDKKKIEEINQSLDPMISQELSELQDEVKTEAQLDKEAPPKSLWEKTKDFAIKTKDVSIEHPFRALWSLLLWSVGVYSAWNYLITWRSEEDQKEYEEKSRWWKISSNVWRLLTHAAWMTAWFFWFKWLYNLYNLEYNADMTDEEKQQLKDWWDYMKNNPEQAKKYMAVWTHVDKMYDHIMKKEKDAWRDAGMDLDTWYEKYVDSSKMDKQTFQGIVPFCIDQEFWSVQDLLSEWWYYSYLREKSWEEMKDEITNRSEQKLLSFMPFLGWLSSAKKHLAAGGSPKKIVGEWAQDGTATERQAELNLFFRQYGKVVVYMQDKKSALIEHIAAEKFKHHPSSFPSLEDAKDDKDWMEIFVYEDERYKKFYEWNMRNAYDVLAKENLMNSDPSETINTIVKWSDSMRDIMLHEKNGEDVLDRLKKAQKTHSSLSAELKSEWAEACDSTLEDIDDNFDEAATYPYLSAIWVAFNTKDNNIQEYLKESGLLWLKNSIKQLLKSFKQKFIEGTIKPTEITAYINLTNQYCVFKKEILIAALSLQSIKDENSDRLERSRQIVTALGMNLWNTTYDGFVALWNTGSSLLNAGAALGEGEFLEAWGELGTAWKEFVKSWLFLSPAMIVWWSAVYYTKYRQQWLMLRRMSLIHVWARKLSYLPGACNLPSGILKATRYNTKQGHQLLLKDLMEGSISDEKFGKIIAKPLGIWDLDLESKDRNPAGFLKKAMWIDIDPAQAKLLFGQKKKFTILRNKSIRELLFDSTQKTSFARVKLQHNLYNYNKTANFKQVMISLQNLDTKYNTLSWEQKKLLWLIMDDMNIDSSKTLTLIESNIDQINVSGMNDDQLRLLMNKLSKDINIMSDKTKLDKIIDDIKKASNAVPTQGVDNLKGHALWDLLNSQLKQLQNATTKPSNYAKQESRIKNLIKELQTLEKSELDQLWDLCSAIQKASKNSDVVSSLSDIHKLWDAAPNKKLIEDAISDLDPIALRKLNLVGVGDVDKAMIDRVAKMMWEIKLHQLKRISNSNELAKAFKTVFKALAKIT